MAHWRTYYDRDILGAWDLDGKDVTVRIARVEKKMLKGKDGKETKKPVLFFEGKEKSFPCPITCSKTIAKLYGNDTKSWVGKLITLYGTTGQAFGEDDVESVFIFDDHVLLELLLDVGDFHFLRCNGSV